MFGKFASGLEPGQITQTDFVVRRDDPDALTRAGFKANRSIRQNGLKHGGHCAASTKRKALFSVVRFRFL
ncbi:MAG: hypothetical protein ABJN05_06395 [Sulfitobacter dubius]|uniref:hypothetical protein n=1 Tax=Sulfitobacter dubius TaxID=218673 RepID=UPI0011135D72|nr:hypothetical protein [Sulfitobacter dubius]